MKNSFLRGEAFTLLCLATVFLFISCTDGYDGDSTWTAGVENVTLTSPDAGKVTVIPSADGSELSVSWPVVLGAGGYEFSLYIVDDPDNPMLVGEEKEIIDGCSVKRDMLEDTYYKVVIRTLGNPKYNNKEAEAATEVEYNNLLPVTAIIPNGANLTEYFATNPIPASSTELCYELEAGGEYTMNGDVPIGSTSVTIRGGKIDHAKISLTSGSFVNGGAGFKLQFLDIDCSDFAGLVLESAIILMDSNFDAATAASSSDGTNYLVIPTTAPVVIQSCKIKDLKQYLFYDNSKKYAIGTLLFKDCVIGQNTSSFNQATIRLQAGMIKDMVFINSTLYNEVVGHGSHRICQISVGNVSSVKPIAETWAGGSMSISNCTFYQFPKGAQSFNSNGAMGQTTDKVSIFNCVVVDSGEFANTATANGWVRRFRRGNTSASFSSGNNSYWYNGTFPPGEVGAGRDESGTHVETDPELTYLGDGKFTMNGSAQITKRIGDPRWLPAE